MHKYPFMRPVMKASWFISAIAAINTGVHPFGIDILKMGWIKMYPFLMVSLHYIVGIAGLISLISLMKACCHACNCGKDSCDMCSSRSGGM